MTDQWDGETEKEYKENMEVKLYVEDHYRSNKADMAMRLTILGASLYGLTQYERAIELTKTFIKMFAGN